MFRVAIVGRPNVGKSSLLNRIIGRERMVVGREPGTTRDAVDTPFEHAGRPYLLVDTAGIRRKGKVQAPLEKLQAYKRRMGWSIPWASAARSDFNVDLGFSSSKEQTREWAEPMLDQLPPIAARNARWS